MKKFFGWLAKQAGWKIYDAVADKLYDKLPAKLLFLRPIIERAIELMRREEQKSEAFEPGALSGESKRRRVYAKLIKEYPNVPKRDLGLAIEAGMQEKPWR